MAAQLRRISSTLTYMSTRTRRPSFSKPLTLPYGSFPHSLPKYDNALIVIQHDVARQSRHKRSISSTYQITHTHLFCLQQLAAGPWLSLRPEPLLHLWHPGHCSPSLHDVEIIVENLSRFAGRF